MRSHPPALSKIVRRTLVEECGVPRGSLVLVAVSGGGDSQALLHALAALRDPLGFELAAHGVDHGLRAEAPRELALAGDLARSLGVPFSMETVSVDGRANVQARARAARRASLAAARARVGAESVATAHHADDRAETVLLRLLGGSGPGGLAVLRPRDGSWIRPMVRARKAAVARHLARHDVAFATDPSNDDRRFLRARVRLDVLPLLETLSPAVVEHLNALSDQLAAADAGVREVRGVALGRAQRAAVARAGRLDRTVRVAVSGGRELVVHGGTGRVDLVEAETAGKRRRPRGGASRGGR